MERKYTSGKWGGAVGIEGEQAAQKIEAESENGDADTVVEQSENTAVEVEELISPETHVHTVSPNMEIVDLYEVGHKSVTRGMCDDSETEVPFAQYMGHRVK